MKRPLIAVMPLYDSEKESYWMLPGYMKGIEAVGGIPVMLPLIADYGELDILAEQFDGFLFTGGQDVSPELYGAEKSSLCGEICSDRDTMEKYMLEKLIELDKPVLGICRGIQIINAVLGGTLYQDIPTEFPSETEHHMSPPYDRPVHSVQIYSDTPLSELLQTDSISVNSYHHQAVKDISEKLNAMAVSKDGLIEAVYIRDVYFAWAVQWHPELSYKNDK